MTMTLEEWAKDAWSSFKSVGGDEAIYAAGLFKTDAQAYYAGQVWAYNRVLYQFGQETQTDTDYASLDSEYRKYE